MTMKHDFENAERGAVIKGAGKTRVTMYLDDDVIEFFREQATANGRGYQTEINAALRGALDRSSEAGTGLQGQMNELVRAVGRIERTVTAKGRYIEHQSGRQVFVREGAAVATSKSKRKASKAS